MLYLLRPADGAVLAAAPTGTDSAVTACSAYFVRKLESVVVTGHANGQTRSFSVVLADLAGLNPQHPQHPQHPHAQHKPGPPAPVMHILPYRLGHKVGGRRHVMVLDRAGNVRLERDNGTARFWGRTNRTQLAVRFVGTYAVMLSAHHTTLLNTLQPRQPRAFPCHHLNGSRLVAAAFDTTRAFRSYGVNARGELLTLVTPHEGRLTACKVHRATPMPWLDPTYSSAAAGAIPASATAASGSSNSDSAYLINGLLPTPPVVAMWVQPLFIGGMLLVGLYQFWRVPLQPRSALRRGGGRDRPTGRVTYAPAPSFDDDDDF
eukprot:XP_001693793.1 predicted protein [Chlamydomonas reinhardtii]